MNNEQTNIDPTNKPQRNEKQPVKLTPLGKLGAFAAGAALIAGGAQVAPAAAEKVSDVAQDVIENVTGTPSYSSESVTHVVQPGETPWSLADLVPGSENYNKQAVISEIEARNPNLDFTKPLPAGVELNLPKNIED